jgi:hypothetical protein
VRIPFSEGNSDVIIEDLQPIPIGFHLFKTKFILGFFKIERIGKYIVIHMGISRLAGDQPKCLPEFTGIFAHNNRIEFLQVIQVVATPSPF